MRFCRNHLSYRVSQSRRRRHVENGERVFALHQASSGQNHGNKVYTRVLQKWQ